MIDCPTKQQDAVVFVQMLSIFQGVKMKKLVAIFAAFFIAQAVQAGNAGVTITKEAISNFQNRTNWSLLRAGDQYTIQNVSGRQLRLDIFVDQFIKGTSYQSDLVYLSCGDKLILTYPAMGIICDLPYPSTVTVYSNPYIRGASGHFTIF